LSGILLDRKRSKLNEREGDPWIVAPRLIPLRGGRENDAGVERLRRHQSEISKAGGKVLQEFQEEETTSRAFFKKPFTTFSERKGGRGRGEPSISKTLIKGERMKNFYTPSALLRQQEKGELEGRGGPKDQRQTNHQSRKGDVKRPDEKLVLKLLKRPFKMKRKLKGIQEKKGHSRYALGGRSAK